MKQAIILSIFTLLLVQCNKKDIKGDLSGEEHIRGRLFLNDTLTQQAIGVPLGKKKVNLAYADSPDSLNFLFTTTTDEEGYFLFQNVRADKIYRLYYEEKIGDVIYVGKDTVSAPADQKRLFAEVAINKQSGLQFLIIDPVGGRIKGAKICVFSNLSSFKTESCDASNFQLTTDDYGRASKININSGTYYILTSYTASNITFSRKDTINVDNQIVQKTLQLQQTKNGISYIVLDTTGAKLSGANLCFFTSPVLFSRDTCEGSNFQIQSDIKGNASKSDIHQDKYYVYASLKAGEAIFVGRDTVQISSTIIMDTIVLRKR